MSLAPVRLCMDGKGETDVRIAGGAWTVRLDMRV